MVVVNVRGKPDSKLTVLPPIRHDATELRCDGNKLTSLPDLKKLTPNLTSLNCDTNQLTALPDLPPMLARLMCSGNNLKVLPNLPPSLTFLGCSYNELKKLPDLPPNLTSLVCRNNQLTSLPDLPPTLNTLNCLKNNFPPDLQAILDQYRQDIPQLIISVNEYNARQMRQTGRNILSLHLLRNRLPLQKYNVSRPPEVPNWLSERVMHTLTGIRTKNVSEKNATTGKIRPPGNLRETLKNLKRKYNKMPGRQNRARKTKKQTRRARKNRRCK
jgi:hypothetical protein